MSQPELVGQIAELLGERLHVEVPAWDADLFATGLLDSLGFVDLLAQLETTFEIRVILDSADLEQFRTVSNIAAFVSAQRGAHWRMGDGDQPTP